MRRKAFFGIVAVCAACAFMFGFAAAGARAQDAPGSISVIVSGEEAEKGKDCCTYLGVFMDELTAGMKEKGGYSHETGVVILSVQPGGPAEKAGVAAGDICYLFDGVKVEDPAHLAKLVKERKAGEKVAMVIFREGKEKKLVVKLDHRASLPIAKDELGSYSVEDMGKIMADAYASAGKLYLKSSMGGRLGMVLLDLNEDIAPYFGVKAGALVYGVEKGSPAEKAGIKGGDVIASVNGTAVETAGCVAGELGDVEKGDKVSLDVLRKGIRKSYTIEADEVYSASKLYVAPFDQGVYKVKKAPAPPAHLEIEKSEQEAAKLKEEMKALQERLKELEERLGEMEKRE